uniref:odorant receptor 131-2-like isoform X1 n=2 Tax=Myxine glutinosa TaxID=7769 RepID=UPI00358F365C
MNENTSNCLNCSQDQELWFVCNGEKIENAIPSSVIIVLWLIIMASVSCNLLVVLSISFKPALWSQTRYLFLSSSLFSDLALLLNSTMILTFTWNRICMPFLICITLNTMSKLLFLCSISCVVAMTAERYVAICHPMRYHAGLCGPQMATLVLSFIWLASLSVPTFFTTMLAVKTREVKRLIICEIQNLESFDQFYTSIKNIMYGCFFVSSSLAVIFTYIQLTLISRRASNDFGASSRALQTVTLHAIHLALLLLSLFQSPFMKWLQNLRSQKLALKGAYIVVFVVLFVLPRLLSPLIYGMRDTKLRQRLKRQVFWAIST